MFMKSAIVALTIVTNPVSAQDEEGTGESRVDLLSGVPYSTSLNCGECIASGFNFCWKTDIPGKILNNDNYPKKNDDFKLTPFYGQSPVGVVKHDLLCSLRWHVPLAHPCRAADTCLFLSPVACC